MPRATPCLTCGTLTPTGPRCPTCHTRWMQTRPKKHRPHYTGDYRKRAKQVRDMAEVCWICGRASLPDDPWTADHIIPGDPQSPLAAAHRSCNSRRGNRPPSTDRPGRPPAA